MGAGFTICEISPELGNGIFAIVDLTYFREWTRCLTSELVAVTQKRQLLPIEHYIVLDNFPINRCVADRETRLRPHKSNVSQAGEVG